METFNHFAELDRNVLSLETMTTWYCTLSSMGKQPTFKDVTYCSASSLPLWKYCLFNVYIYQNSKIPFRLFMVHSHCPTPTQTTTKMGSIVINSSLCLCRCLCSMNTSTQFYTTHFLSVSVSVSVSVSGSVNTPLFDLVVRNRVWLSAFAETIAVISLLLLTYTTPFKNKSHI